MSSITPVAAASILAFVADRGFLADPGDALRTPVGVVTNVRADTAADSGSLSWLSDRVARTEPGRAESFRGALLLASAQLASASATRAMVVRCRNPKLAFSLVVRRFFAPLLEIEWPSAGQSAPGTPIGSNPRFGPGAVIGPGCSIGNNVDIGPNSVIANTVIADDVTIGANCTIGLPGYGYERDDRGVPIRFPHLGAVRIARGVEIGSNVCIDRGSLDATSVGENCKIDNLVHIAHNVTLEAGCMVIANSMIAGSVRVGRNAWVAPSVSVLNQIQVGDDAVIGMGAVVIRSVPAGTTVVGNPARQLTREQRRAE